MWVLWNKLCPPQNPYIEAYTLVAHNMITDRAITVVIKVK